MIAAAAWKAVSQQKDLPLFFKADWSRQSLVYLSNEPDRWKGPSEPSLKAGEDPEHFFDIEPILDSEIPVNRYLAMELYRSRAIKPEEIGFLPYAIIETFQKARAAFRQLRKQGKRPAHHIERVVIHHSGVLAHYVGDAAQPLHVTMHHHGWVGDNPMGFATDRSIHRKFEDEFVRLNIKGDEVSKMAGSSANLPDPFQSVVRHLRASHALVPDLYELERKGAFASAAPEGRTFVLERLKAGAQMLADLWYSAWVQSANP